MQDLKGKVAVVTGGASGIGLGIAQALARAEMRVVVADIEATAADKTASDLLSIEYSGGRGNNPEGICCQQWAAVQALVGWRLKRLYVGE